MSYYRSLDILPLVAWEKCTEGDLTALRIDQDKGTHEEDSGVWEALNYEYLELFGVDRSRQKHAQLMKELLSKELELIETGNRIIENYIRRIKAEIQNLLSDERKAEGMSIEDSLVYLSKFMGFMLNKEDLKTRKYFTLVYQYGKVNQKK